MKKIKIEIEPIGKRIYIDKPTNGMKAISDAGIEMKSVCGGRGTCVTLGLEAHSVGSDV